MKSVVRDMFRALFIAVEKQLVVGVEEEDNAVFADGACCFMEQRTVFGGEGGVDLAHLLPCGRKELHRAGQVQQRDGCNDGYLTGADEGCFMGGWCGVMP